MERAKSRLLEKRGLSQQRLGCCVVAGVGGLFGLAHDRAKFACFRQTFTLLSLGRQRLADTNLKCIPASAIDRLVACA